MSKCYNGSIHDKKIWNKEYASVKHLFNKVILGDKDYAGGMGENQILFRPVKRNELEYKTNKVKTKSYNKDLSQIRVSVEHVFAQLKNFKIIQGIFPLKNIRFGEVFKAIAVVYNAILDTKL